MPGFAVVDELALLVSAGLGPWQALRTATAAPGAVDESKFRRMRGHGGR